MVITGVQIMAPGQTAVYRSGSMARESLITIVLVIAIGLHAHYPLGCHRLTALSLPELLSPPAATAACRPDLHAVFPSSDKVTGVS